MSLSLSITQTQIIKGLGDLLTDILPNTVSVVAGQVNRVATPKGNYCVMNATGRARLATNQVTWAATSDVTEVSCQMSMQTDIRVDVHGPNSADYSTVIAEIMRDAYAYRFMEGIDAPVRPLFASDPQQVPFITAESQWEDRWIMNIAMQANPVLTIPTQFASELTVIMNNAGGLFITWIGDNSELVTFTGDSGGGLAWSTGLPIAV